MDFTVSAPVVCITLKEITKQQMQFSLDQTAFQSLELQTVTDSYYVYIYSMLKMYKAMSESESVHPVHQHVQCVLRPLVFNIY